ncbi:hypothetical protein ACIBQ6_48440 [Nonomuraea sp. NPDC049655]|uniref:hypothetical protein n=1 Tax=Nonomuraea sp. NPDC049655 TaxID=3364355 RepID=UPI0037A8F54C
MPIMVRATSPGSSELASNTTASLRNPAGPDAPEEPPPARQFPTAVGRGVLAVAQSDLSVLVVQHHGAVRLPGDGDAGLGQDHCAYAIAEVTTEVGQVGQHQPGGGLDGGQPVT